MQDIMRLGPSNALANVEDVGNNKDCENRGLGDDQAVHSHWPPRGKTPSNIALGHRYGRCAHLDARLLVLPVGIFRMLEVPQRAAALDLRDGSEVIRWRRRSGG